MDQGRAGPSSRKAVFYNPAMALSRDISIAVLTAESARRGKKLDFWDVTAATGVRSMRILKETDAVGSVLATDNNELAVEVLKKNADREGSGRINVVWKDAAERIPPGTFDAVDIDPFGTPVPFVEAGISAVREGGILAVTATDMAVLAGPARDACVERYSSSPLRNYLCREAGLRILLAYLARLSRLRGRSVTPLLSIISGYYVRCIVRLSADSGVALPIGVVPFKGYSGPPLRTKSAGGPMWLGPLHDSDFISRIGGLERPGCGRASFKKFIKILKDETKVDVLFYYESGVLSRQLHLESPPPLSSVAQALSERGYAFARTHASEGGWRTDAPASEVEDAFGSLKPGARLG